VSHRGIAAALVAVAAAGAALVGWDTTTQSSAPAATVTTATLPAAGDPLDGATVFRTKGCAQCHTGPDTAGMIPIGPDLSDASEWAGDRRPGVSAEEYIAESVRTPGAFVSPAFEPMGGPTTGMPQLHVSDDELDALVRYLLDE
jgi:cytochrome c551/c552